MNKIDEDFNEFMFEEAIMSLPIITKGMNNEFHSAPINLDDLSHYPGRLSICDQMTFSDSRLFGNDDIEVTDW